LGKLTFLGKASARAMHDALVFVGAVWQIGGEGCRSEKGAHTTEEGKPGRQLSPRYRRGMRLSGPADICVRIDTIRPGLAGGREGCRSGQFVRAEAARPSASRGAKVLCHPERGPARCDATPVKITVKDQPVFLCCKACDARAQRNPETELWPRSSSRRRKPEPQIPNDVHVTQAVNPESGYHSSTLTRGVSGHTQ
jgi:hypothetical protein